MDSFLYQASIYLLAAVVAVPIAARFGLGSVLGYLMAGLIIGPMLGLVGSETEDLRHFAEFGVVMMLFLIGLELEPKALWDMRHRLLGLGGLQITCTMALVTMAGLWLDYSWQQSLTAGTILSLSSTAIVLQTLSEKKLMNTPGGRSAFAVLLTQDIAVIPMLALLPLLAFAPVVRVDSHATEGAEAVQAARSLIESLPAWGVTLVTLAAVAVIVLSGTYLMRPIFKYIHTARLRELYTALALLIVLGIALLMSLVGLSPALGTFLAGVVLANSEFRHELESDIEPFKGLLLGLFFITVGAGIDVQGLASAPVSILGLTLGLMAAKGLVLYGLGLLFKLKGRDAWLFTLGLAQAGEFGFVLTSFSIQQRVILPGLGDRLLLVIALSMLLTPLAFILYEQISKRIGEGDAPEADEIDERHPILIAGIGRFGQVVNRLVTSSGFRTTVLDNDLETIEMIRTFGFKSFFGDPTRPDLLHAAGIDKAEVLVVSLDDPKAAIRLVTYARKRRPDIYIIARARDRVHVFQLYRAGADKIVREVFDASLRAGRYVLEQMGLSEYEAHQAESTFYKMDRSAMQGLAEVWDPDIPIHLNQAYMERSRLMNRDMEAALMNLFASDEEDAA
ncbi:monovalent cation:proton antiporter-2 (CPA2) family protein [Frigidibacter sp. ROC022]|uniref:monovalent cation:proton antiporter-2 (CPA2) family protein n=1 Tax=Frigidibacter sp. ROC022 TaxID=2971796 RepID=UPI00215A8770|nr:monovalent cation:proton antiporter-2 (CPA2) family protein [Frigidibacter sp. ROC022]MCR8723771.1 monovalent cation:proton antiporter-2 (CPA2) family protein [Frigidibacter sp. ROC022]